MRIEPEISSVSVILLGDFNPAIFTPAWFALHDLLPKGAAESADLNVAHPQTTSFTADWLQLNVLVDQFSAETRQAPHIRLCDLVVRVFGEHLFHTPLRALGINRQVHFRVRDSSARDRIGRTLAPVDAWGAWGAELGESGRHGGMTSVTMTQVNIPGRSPDDKINITVEPSNRVGVDVDGVYARVNDHYAVTRTEGRPADHLMDVLERNFESSLRRGESLIDQVMSLASI